MSDVNWPFVIKFDVKYHQVRGKAAKGFGADRIGILVAICHGMMKLP